MMHRSEKLIGEDGYEVVYLGSNFEYLIDSRSVEVYRDGEIKEG